MTDQTHAQRSSQDQRSSYDQARDKASHAYASSKASARDGAQRATEALETNPLAILVGGLAVGALAGALIPRSARERELLSPLGQRLGDTARQAFAAAKDAGKLELDGAGLTPGAARDRGKDVLNGLMKALTSAGTAAAQAAKPRQA